MPVSTEGFGSAFSSPLASRLNCINTKFQISTYRPHSHGNTQSVCASFDDAGPISKKISLQGPHGPVSPIAQKLSFKPGIATTRSAAAPVAFHKSAASASTPSIFPGEVSAPPKTVKYNFSTGSPNHSGDVTNSHAYAIASFLK